MSLPGILRRSMPAIAAIALLLASACGDDAENEPNNADAAVAAAPNSSYTVVTIDNEFSITRMTVPANQKMTVNVRNDGQALHNWHVLDVKDASGDEIETKLLKNGESVTARFTLTSPGRYDFRCDTHPAEMKGTLTVQ